MKNPPWKILWSHDGEEISYIGPRPGVSLVIDKSKKTVVSLILAEARLNDSGIYICEPLQREDEDYLLLPKANISVHVIEGVPTHQLSGEPVDKGTFLVLLMGAFCALGGLR